MTRFVLAVLVLSACDGTIGSLDSDVVTDGQTSALDKSWSLFAGARPVLLGQRDGADHELGVRFSSREAGHVVAMRFYKSPGETGRHVGHLWSDLTGQAVASVAFENETDSGWQRAALEVPARIEPGTDYVVSVNTVDGLFVETIGGLGSPLTSGPLTTSAGLSGPVGALPSQRQLDSNPFRDLELTQ